MISISQRVWHGFAPLFSLRLVSIPVGIILSILLARWLGPTDYGLLTLTLGLNTVFTILSDPGIGHSVIKHIAEYRHKDPSVLKQTISQVIVIRLILSLVASLLCFFLSSSLSRSYDNPNLADMLKISSLFIFTNSVFTVFDCLLLGFERIRASAIVQFMSSSLPLPICVLLVHFGFGVVGAYFGYLSSTFIAMGVAAIFFLKEYKQLEPGNNIIKKVLQYGLPLWLSGAAFIIYSNLDRVMLGYFWPTSEVAFYSIAFSLVQTTMILPSALNSVYFPIVSNVFAAGDISGLEQLFLRTIKYLLILFVPAAAGIFYIASPFVTLLYTNEYLQSALLARIMAVNLIPATLMAILSAYFSASGRAGRLTLYIFIATGINAALNLALIPKYGATGAALASVGTQFILLFLAMRDHLSLFNFSVRKGVPIFRIVLSTAVMVGVLYGLFPLRNNVFSLILAVVVGVVIYFGCLFILRGLSVRELKQFRF